jgi:hypothetical protein
VGEAIGKRVTMRVFRNGAVVALQIEPVELRV